MADDQIPVPVSSGATDNPGAPQSGAPATPPPVPPGFGDEPPAVPAGFGDTPPGTPAPGSTENGQNPSASGAGAAVEDAIKNVATGAGKGLGDTVSGIGTLLNKIPGVGEILAPKVGLEAEKSMIGKPEGTAQWIGYGGENLAEFMLGDEALKGLSLADKFKQISGVMNILEKSPRLMRAIQMGADVGKAATELGPEEQAAIKKSPILARLVGAGMDAVRQGAVQGAQTLTKTGGDVGEAAKSAAETGVASGVLGSAFGLLGRAAEKAGEAGTAVKTASEAGASAPTTVEAGQKVADQIKAANDQMHGDFETGIQKLKGDLGDQKVPYQGSPIQKAAKATLDGITDKQVVPGKVTEAAGFGKGVLDATKEPDQTVRSAKGVLNEFGSLAGGSPESKNLLASLADPKKTGDLTIDELVQRRQQLGEKIGNLTKGATSSADRADVAVYQKLRDGIDDTIDALAKGSGKPEASQDYDALRSAYKAKVNLFKEPVIKAIQEGDLDSAGKYLLAGGKTLDKVNTLTQVIGDQGVKQFGKDIVARTLADASTENGQINPAKFVKDFKKIDSLTPEVKDKLFDMAGVEDGLGKLASDLKSAANYQKLVRSGVLSAAGGAGAAVHPAGGLGVLLGVLGAGDMGKATEVLDKIANNPKLWGAFRTAGKIGATLEQSPAARRAVGAAAYGTGNALSNIMQGAQQPLSNDEDQSVVYTNQ